jgi:hypothetical protein
MPIPISRWKFVIKLETFRKKITWCGNPPPSRLERMICGQRIIFNLDSVNLEKRICVYKNQNRFYSLSSTIEHFTPIESSITWRPNPSDSTV